MRLGDNVDKIYLNNIEIFAKHGVFKEEKVLGQKFILSVEVGLNTREAAITGNLEKSIHYGELCHNIEEVFKEESYDLIETAVEKVAEYILYNYDIVYEVKVKLKKPWAPISRHLDYAAIEILRGWHKVYLSIGSNIGDRLGHLNDAINRINDTEGIRVSKVSKFIETEPWGNEDQESFLNGAIEIKTILNPIELMQKLLNIELDMKRTRIIKWGPRNIDIDVIFYDDLVLDNESCTIPHPRMEERLFVLEPLNEIASNKVHPILNKRVFRLLEDLKGLLD